MDNSLQLLFLRLKEAEEDLSRKSLKLREAKARSVHAALQLKDAEAGDFHAKNWLREGKERIRNYYLRDCESQEELEQKLQSVGVEFIPFLEIHKGPPIIYERNKAKRLLEAQQIDASIETNDVPQAI